MPKANRRPSTSIFLTYCRVSDSIRFDKFDHFVKHTDDKKRKIYVRKDFKSIFRTMCVKWYVVLCIHCFIPFSFTLI